MNNKTLILIGLCICLLFTLPMVSAAEISADSGLIDNSVFESNFDNVDSDIASSIEDDTNMDGIVADDGDISQIPAKGEKLAQQKERNLPKAIQTMIFYLQMAVETVSQI